MKAKKFPKVGVGIIIKKGNKILLLKRVKIGESTKSTKINWFDLNNLPKPLFIPSKDNINNFKNKRVF